MAGIAGIIVKKADFGKDTLHRSLASMMQKLSSYDSHLTQTFESAHVSLGNSVPMSCAVNDHFQQNDQLGLIIAIEGLVFVDSQERSILNQHYDITNDSSDYNLLPYLYHLYEQDFVKHITGWFNICIYDRNHDLILLVNDRLGFLPVYYYHSDACCLFSSKIEAILNSGLVPSIQPDPATIAEHLFFNYTITDHSYIKNIHTLSNAEFLRLTREKTVKEKYWSMGELFGFPPADAVQSFDLMNQGLNLAMEKVFNRYDGKKLNFTLTGGWDSRVLLSLCLPENRHMLSAYSFGAANSSDIVIPQKLAKAENLDYTPYVLDQDYLDKEFLPNALKTIELSGGTRNYKRTHYLYAVQQRTNVSDVLLTGIFGDEVFKVAGPAGGEVLSQNLIDWLNSDFDLDFAIARFTQTDIPNALNISRDILIDAFEHRLNELRNQMNGYDTRSQKYYAFRFEYNLRKYFGHEANSYNDYIHCFSPFIDHDFLKMFARSSYFGAHYPFGSQSMRLKKQSACLYHDITSQNYQPLVSYNSARGYSMQDAQGMFGNIKILYQRFANKPNELDDFNTKTTDDIFFSFLKNAKTHPVIYFDSINPMTHSLRKSDYLSLYYWFGEINKRYCDRC